MTDPTSSDEVRRQALQAVAESLTMDIDELRGERDEAARPAHEEQSDDDLVLDEQLGILERLKEIVTSGLDAPVWDATTFS